MLKSEMSLETFRQLHPELQKRGWEMIKRASQKLAPGCSEKAIFTELESHYKEMGVTQIWHPTCVKFNEATRIPGVRHKASDSVLLEDIMYFDLGVVIDGVEVDCGKTFGFTPEAQKIAEVSEIICRETAEKILSNQKTLSPAEAYRFMESRAKHYGYELAADTAGHRLGPYPTSKREIKMSGDDAAPSFTSGGWMIEVHIRDEKRGAFFEDVLYLRDEELK